LGDRENTYTDIKYTNDTFVQIDFTQKIWLVEGSSRTYLPDASLSKPKTGYPLIIVHNQNNSGDITIYPINSSQRIGGETSFVLKRKHTAWFVPYDEDWTVILNNNTNV
jgi:hypothetical protein